MQGSRVITLTTDFGYDDAFVGVMKGVIRTINPNVEIIDITHGIPPQDIRTASYVIGTSYRYFPKDSIHMVVVDPGVGSERRPIIVMTDLHYFIGPDNGVFSYVFREPHEQLEVTAVTAEHYFLDERGATFHGRDIFSPVAAWFSKGIVTGKLGDVITDYRRIELPLPRAADGELAGEVILIDRFGNAITNITAADITVAMPDGRDARAMVRIGRKTVGMKKFYAQGSGGGLHALVNSSDYLELFVYCGNAAAEHGISVGDPVVVSAVA